jgi:PAS domain S-box-containing protein
MGASGHYLNLPVSCPGRNVGPWFRERGASMAISHTTAQLQALRIPLWSLVGIPGYGSEELLRLALQAARVGIFETDLKLQRTRFSPELCELLGLPVGSEMESEEAWKVVHELDRPKIHAAIQDAVNSADQGSWSGVYRLLRADGTIRWASIHGKRIYRQVGGDFEPVWAVGAVVDVTDLKEKKEALLESEHRLGESERRLRFALDAAQIGTFEANLSGTEAIIDAQEARLLGLPNDTRAVSVDELRKRVPLEDQASGDLKLERLTRHGDAFHHEFRLRMPDKSVRWLSGHADIRANRMFGVNFDITQSKLAETRLRESEERLRTATSSAELGVFEWDVEADRAVWESGGMYAIFGRERAQGPLTGQQLMRMCLHPHDQPRFYTALKLARESRGRLRTTVRIRLAGGTLRWIQIDAKFQGEAASRLLGVIVDITERKQLEERAKALSEKLVTIQEHERQQIALELHDSTAQHLVAVNLNLMHLRPSEGLSSSATQVWDETMASLEEALTELRAFSFLMHPPALEDAGLCSSLKQYVDEYSGRSGLPVELRTDPALDELPHHFQRTLLRIVQEALLNVYRHAEGASRALVVLRLVRHQLHLVVSDDGRGIADNGAEPDFTPGRGLGGMTARVQQYNGQLRIRSRARGTRLHAVMSTGGHSSES